MTAVLIGFWLSNRDLSGDLFSFDDYGDGDVSFDLDMGTHHSESISTSTLGPFSWTWDDHHHIRPGPLEIPTRRLKEFITKYKKEVVARLVPGLRVEGYQEER